MNKVSGKTLKDEFTYKDFLNGRIEIPGKPLNSFYSYRFTGLSREDGRPTFYGMDEEQFRKQFEGMSRDEIYMTVMDYSGNRVPVFQGSLRNTFSYKRFTLAVNMVYSFGTKIRLLSLYPNVSASYGTIAPQPENNVRRELLKRWKIRGMKIIRTFRELCRALHLLRHLQRVPQLTGGKMLPSVLPIISGKCMTTRMCGWSAVTICGYNPFHSAMLFLLHGLKIWC